MRLFHAVGAAQLLAARLVVTAPLDSPATPVIHIDSAVDPLDALAQLQRHAYDTLERNDVVSKRDSEACSLANTAIRQDWYVDSVKNLHLLTLPREHMSKPDRKAYIEAVQCLRTLPSKSDTLWAPAAKTRFDDFVAIHVNQTMYIHGNGLFLTWHRYFVWAYEQALRNECGYKGYQPVSLGVLNHF